MARSARIDRGYGSCDRRDGSGAREGRYLSVAVDTNVIVRVLVQDHPHQAALARAKLSQDFTLLATVLVETEWVLRSFYLWPRERIAAAFTELADLPSLRDAPAGLAWAIARYAAGGDFADMLHVAGTAPAHRFATFDRRIARSVGADAPVSIETLA